MSGLRRLLARVLAIFRRGRLDRELDAELASHLELAVDDYVARGMSPEEARRAARIDFGGLEIARELHRESRGLPFVDAIAQDLRHGLRMLRRYSGLTLFAVLIVGLGVGASATVFSVVNAMLLRPLPFDDPDRLVWIQNDVGPTRSEKTIQVGYLLGLQRDSEQLVDVAGWDAFYRQGDHRVGGSTEPERLTGIGVTPGFFPLLGVTPRVGRLFDPAEFRSGPPAAVVISHGVWQRRFGSDPQAVGRTLTIDDRPVPVVGVLPASFDFAGVFEPGQHVDLYFPFPLSPETNRQGNTLYLVGRMAADATVESTRTEVQALAALLDRDPALQPAADRQLNGFSPVVTTLRERVSGTYRPALILLASAVGLVMLIVCANLSNLLLARDATREKELVIRAALGAGRGRLLQQLLTESVILSSIGAGLGLALALAGTRLLAGLDTVELPLRRLVQLDATAVAFTVTMAVATGLLFGIIPALRMSSPVLHTRLQEAGRGSSRGRGHAWARDALVVGEVALACVLLVGAGLLTRSFVRLLDVELGFRPANTVTVRIDTNRPSGPEERERRTLYLDEALRAVRSVDDVEAAGLIDSLPLGFNRRWNVRPAESEEPRRGTYVHVVSEGYLTTMGVDVAAGRDFTARDDRAHPAVVLVNESLARVLWPGKPAIGERVDIYGDVAEVIGVVRDVRHRGPEHEAGEQLYLPMRQVRAYRSMHLVVRGPMERGALIERVRVALRPVAPNLPLHDFRTVQDIVDRSVSPRTFVVALLAGFAGFALVLAALGIYAVISFSVSQRRREIGIRIALGATARELQLGILTATLRVTALGLLIGTGAAWVLGHTLRGLLFGIGSADPTTFVTVPSVLLAVAALAGYLPARRASRLNAVEVLRAE